MIAPSTLLTFAAVVLGLFLIPGPAVLLVIGRATTGGRRVGIATGLGVACGDLGHTLMATVGLSAVLMTSALAFDLVKYAGVAYLFWLGVRAFVEKSGDLDVGRPRPVQARVAFRQAVLAELLNPKTALFFLAFLPQFVHPERGAVALQLATLGLLFSTMSALYTAAIALAAGHLAGWLARHRRIGRWQGRIVGTIYLGIGARLVSPGALTTRDRDSGVRASTSEREIAMAHTRGTTSPRASQIMQRPSPGRPAPLASSLSRPRAVRKRQRCARPVATRAA